MIAALLLQAAASPAPPAEAQARDGIARGLEYLLSVQEKDGAFGHWRRPESEFWSNLESHKSWQVATTGLACMALMDAGSTDAHWAALDRAVDHLSARAAVKRPSDWDVDNVWGYVYGLAALTQASAFPRYADAGQEPRRAAMRAMGEALLEKLWKYQTPSGGWSYYDDETLAYRPSWATSFTTAVAVLGLLDARQLGWKVDAKRLQRAVAAVQRCRMPNGAYTYNVETFPSLGSLENIDQIKGSLSRIQVCNLALWRAQRELGIDSGITEETLRQGLAYFFREHRFLDVALKRPIPHEAYYYNSGYFYFFGHYYAAFVIQLLPEADRRHFATLLWREILKLQQKDGSMWDFYMNSYGKPYGVGFGVSALRRSLPAPAPGPE
ncbi:MAG: hypothetical protein EYC70_04835 [Planctomycetota bacterium]|nr:MAG: hypothetical protein EYC70_04835 [Planctomycetota bacterium]